MNATIERPNRAATASHQGERVSWTGLLYGHMMPGLPLAASRLAAEQQRRRADAGQRRASARSNDAAGE